MNSPVSLLILLGSISLAPFFFMMLTSFVKITVVLSIVRSAIGTQQIPPNQILIGLSIILTLFVMAPVGLEIKNELGDYIQASETFSNPKSSLKDIEILIEKGREPLRNFLNRHSHTPEKNLFCSLASQFKDAPVSPGQEKLDFLVLMPAFVISELKEAFEIGFLLFLPFIAIDMIVANILQAMGMVMLSPSTISLPFKLLLFVLIDGWGMITKGLIESYF
jgi:type III secretion protein R